MPKNKEIAKRLPRRGETRLESSAQLFVNGLNRAILVEADSLNGSFSCKLSKLHLVNQITQQSLTKLFYQLRQSLVKQSFFLAKID